MNKKYLGIFICTVTMVFLSFKFLSTEETKLKTTPTSELTNSSGITPHSDPWAFQTVALKNDQQQKVSEQETIFTAAVQEQMADISEAFAENMRYPNYSKPLNKNDWTLLHPRAFVPKAVALEGLKNTSAEIIIPHFIVTREESVPVTVKVVSSGKNPQQVQSITLLLGQELKEVALTSTSSTAGESRFNSILKSSLLKTIPEKDVIISADIVFDDLSRAKVSTVFKLVGTEAVLESLSTAYVDETDLVIPANFSVDIAGHYRIQANLFDKETLSPISHLNNTFSLDTGKSSGLLKVHAETLRSKGFPGPYILKDFNITRSPAAPGDQTGYGSSKEDSFEVQGFDLDSYSREAYQDKHSQQRLQFLQKMAGLEEK